MYPALRLHPAPAMTTCCVFTTPSASGGHRWQEQEAEWNASWLIYPPCDALREWSLTPIPFLPASPDHYGFWFWYCSWWRLELADWFLAYNVYSFHRYLLRVCYMPGVGRDDRTPHKMDQVLALTQLTVLWGKGNPTDKKQRITKICNYGVRQWHFSEGKRAE